MKSGLIGLQDGSQQTMFSKINKVQKRMHGQDGFSLLETLTALTILAISMGALLSNFTGSLKGAGRAISATEARILAQSLIAENVAGSEFRVGLKTGQYKGYRWSVEIFPVSDSWSQTTNQGNWKLYKINVRVRQGRSNLFQLEQIKLGRGYE